MTFSIQQEIIKINSRISNADAVSLAITSFIVLVFALFLVQKESSTTSQITYYSNGATVIQNEDSRPFGSKNGTTYTYSWCQGADRIKSENVVYFANAEIAEQSGRTLSKLCQR